MSNLQKLAEKWREEGKGFLHEDIQELFEDCADELEAAIANQWQPIETAPKDGTEILLLDHRDRVRIGSFRFDVYRDEDGPTWLADDFEDYSTGYASTLLMPIHWMPLPTPPHE